MNQTNVLLFHHNGGGGVDRFITHWKKEHNDLTIYEAFVEHQKITIHCNRVPIQSIPFTSLKERISQLNISYIHIHHLWLMELSSLVKALQELQIPYTFWIHDFYSICPFAFFVNQKGQYCGRPKEERVCDACASRGARRVQMEQMLTTKNPSITQWRTLFGDVLKGADQVIAPSVSAKESTLEYIPDLKITVLPHSLTQSFEQSKLKKTGTPVRIALLGNLAYHKGDQEIRTLLTQTNHLQISCEFYHYGAPSHLLDKHSFPHFHKRGRYSSPGQLPQLLQKDLIDFVLIPSICPETFSYTTHEAISMGYPVLCFDLGAQAEVVKQQGAGWVVSIKTPHSLFLKVTELVNDPQKIDQKRKETLQFARDCLRKSD